jgi:dipeptidyl aminopeptidase/acylaminoacyl peptidase
MKRALAAFALALAANAIAADPAVAQPYAEFTLHAMLSWHPQRREIVVGRCRSEACEAERVAAPGASPEPLNGLDGSIGHAEYQPLRGESIAFTRASRGAPRLYRLDELSGAVAALSAEGSRVSYFAWSPRGDRIAFAAVAASGRTTFTLVDPLQPRTARTLASFEKGDWRDLGFSPDGRKLVFVELVAPRESRVWVLDVAGGARGRVTPLREGHAVFYASPQFSRDGRGLFVRSDLDSDFVRLAFLPLGPGRERALSTQAFDVDEIAVSQDAQRVAFTTNENGSHVLRFLDAATMKELPRPPLFDGVVGGLAWRPGSDELAFHISAARTALDVYSYELGANRLARWTNGNNAAVNTRELAEPAHLHWHGADGRELSGFLYLPPASFAAPRPVVVMLHGPGAQAQPAFIARYNYLVSDLGAAVLYPNPHGSAGFGKAFRALDDGTRRDEAAGDIAQLLDWIAANPALDAKRVILCGGAGGADIARASAARDPARVAAVVAHPQASDEELFAATLAALEGLPKP